MNKQRLKDALLLLLVIAVAFVSYRYVVALREKQGLLDGLRKARAEIAKLQEEEQKLLLALEKEKEAQQQLVQEREMLKDELAASQKRLAQLFSDAVGARKAIERLSLKYELLRQENQALIAKGKGMQVEVAEAIPIQPQLDSAAELKKAIHELRKQISKVNREIRNKIEAQESADGNHGFIIKDGKATYKGRIRIEVSSVT